MPILPVLDLMQGQIVRGIAGRRAEYRPIVSTLTRSTWPCDVAGAIAQQFDLHEYYLADLDAIGGQAPARAVYERLQADGRRLWVDAGVRTLEDACAVAALGVWRIVVGLETVQSPDALAAMVAALGADRVVFSLDLRDGQPLGNAAAWGSAGAEAIADRAVAAGVKRLLVLDLSRVGVGTGTGTEAVCTRLRAAQPELAIAAGGGVRCAADVARLYDCGVEHVLVASALHDGRLTCEEVVALDRGARFPTCP